MREIVFDTETTGLSFAGGDRMVEIGCVEMVNRVRDRAAPSTPISIPSATCRPRPQRVHGLSDAFLSDKPLFHDEVEDLLEFLGDARWSRTMRASTSASSTASSAAAAVR